MLEKAAGTFERRSERSWGKLCFGRFSQNLARNTVKKPKKPQPPRVIWQIIQSKIGAGSYSHFFLFTRIFEYVLSTRKSRTFERFEYRTVGDMRCHTTPHPAD